MHRCTVGDRPIIVVRAVAKSRHAEITFGTLETAFGRTVGIDASPVDDPFQIVGALVQRFAGVAFSDGEVEGRLISGRVSGRGYAVCGPAF
jgi:hypothetical protein